MHDIQNEVDERGVEIDEVGISGLRYPVCFDDGHLVQDGIGEVAITVRLPHDRRGTHMSRMVALAHEHLQHFSPQEMPAVLKAGADLLDAPGIIIAVAMPIGTRVLAPVSRVESWQIHDILVQGSLQGDTTSVTTSVTCDVTSLCPCSKAISDYGAHNQRSRITLAVTGHGDAPYPLPIHEAIEILRGSASAPVVPLVKRPDERMLTMTAFDHPVFVEDMARDVSRLCRSRDLRHEVRVRNLESIHSHDAVARITG